jgi:hypothetical protein
VTSKGHFNGPKLQGTHTTVIGDFERVLSYLEPEEWFTSARAGKIENISKNGQPFVRLTLPGEHSVAPQSVIVDVRENRTIQQILIQVEDGDFTTATPRIIEAIRKKLKGMQIIDRTKRDDDVA